MSNSGDSRDTETDEFIKSYISQIKNRVGDTLAKPNSEADSSLLFTDTESPQNRKVFYTIQQAEAIAQEECVECEYLYRKCTANPPTMLDRVLGCRKLRAEYYRCMDMVKEEVKKKSSHEPLVSLEQVVDLLKKNKKGE
ncbi:hypothetical protein LPJ72_005505 [Coemansia sp. Benny D160-2]|nr:hypothetical protein LPJ72_005505 [Coemansia sp. Benny D160-2]